MSRVRFVPTLTLAFVLLAAAPLAAQDARDAYRVEFLQDQEPVHDLEPMAATACDGGFAGTYPCLEIDLLAFMPLSSIGGGSGNDVWGWTDPLTGIEYAIMGRSSGTSFVDISDPENPVYLGNLPPNGSNSSWRDIKVYNNHAYIVSEAAGHGIEISLYSPQPNVASM